jgi:hypothetical protein
MTKKAFIPVSLVILVATAALLRDRKGPDMVIQPMTTSAEAPLRARPSSDVQVRHEFITLTVPPLAPPRVASAGLAPRPAATLRPASAASSEAEPALGQATLIQKARRALVGDGRYRPEPFPRIRDN